MHVIQLSKQVADLRLSVDVTLTERITGLFGPSGCGKTTLLNCVAGLSLPQSGRVVIGDRIVFDSSESINVAARHRRVGYVFQDSLLFEHLTVKQNLLYARPKRNGPSLDQVCEVLELGRLLGASARVLSGGEKRRVAIGRALLSAPDLLLLDEPLTGLDRRLAGKTLSYVKRTLDAFDTSAIYVSHSVGDIKYLCNHVMVMDHGRVQSLGPAAMHLAKSAIESARHSVKNIFTLSVKRCLPDQALIECDLDNQTLVVSASIDPSASQVTLVLPSEDIMLAREKPRGLSARNVLVARVDTIEQFDGHAVVVVDAGIFPQWFTKVTHTAIDELGISAGSRVYLVIKASSIACVDAR